MSVLDFLVLGPIKYYNSHGNLPVNIFHEAILKNMLVVLKMVDLGYFFYEPRFIW